MLKLNIEGWRLRPLEQKDADALQAILAQYDVAKSLTPIPHPFPKGAAQSWLTEKLKDMRAENTAFAIVNPQDDVCGNVGFDWSDRGKSILGYYLDMPYWGKGLMSDAVARVLAWLFAHSELSEVHSGVLEFNRASLALQKRVGFVEVEYGMEYCAAQECEFPYIGTKLTQDDFNKMDGGRYA